MQRSLPCCLTLLVTVGCPSTSATPPSATACQAQPLERRSLRDGSTIALPAGVRARESGRDRTLICGTFDCDGTSVEIEGFVLTTDAQGDFTDPASFEGLLGTAAHLDEVSLAEGEFGEGRVLGFTAAHMDRRVSGVARFVRSGGVYHCVVVDVLRPELVRAEPVLSRIAESLVAGAPRLTQPSAPPASPGR